MAPPPLGKESDGGRTASILADGTLVCVAWGGGVGGAAMAWIESASPGLGLSCVPPLEEPPEGAAPEGAALGREDAADWPAGAEEPELPAPEVSSLGRVFTAAPPLLRR